jgi:hypothetical protein
MKRRGKLIGQIDGRTILDRSTFAEIAPRAEYRLILSGNGVSRAT